MLSEASTTPETSNPGNHGSRYVGLGNWAGAATSNLEIQASTTIPTKNFDFTGFSFLAGSHVEGCRAYSAVL